MPNENSKYNSEYIACNSLNPRYTLGQSIFLIFKAATLPHSFRTSDPFRDANDPTDRVFSISDLTWIRSSDI